MIYHTVLTKANTSMVYVLESVSEDPAKNIKNAVQIFTVENIPDHEVLFLNMDCQTNPYNNEIIKLIEWLSENVGRDNYKISVPLEYVKSQTNIYDPVILYLNNNVKEEKLYIQLKWGG